MRFRSGESSLQRQALFALGPEVSVLESQLASRGLTVALTHYRQAVDCFVDSRLEASNGQLRSFLESLVTQLYSQRAGNSIRDPRGAIDGLRNRHELDGDEAKLLAGLIGLSNERGAHPGLTDRDEALFRLHMTTASARYLLARLAR
jgi:hypothetical protein